MLDPRPERRPSAAALVGGPAGTEVRRPVAAPPSSLAAVGGRRRARGRARSLAGVAGRRRETGDAPTTTAAPRRRRGLHRPALPAVRAAARRRAPTAGAASPGSRTTTRTPATAARRPPTGSPTAPPFPEGADPIEGTIVPRDDVDTFAMAVGDGSQLLCDGRFTVRLTAPDGHDAAPRGARRRRGARARPPAPTACRAR